MAEPLIPLGEIVSIHGIKGWLKLKPYNPETTALFSNQEIFFEKGGACSSHRLEAIRAHKGLFLLKVQEINVVSEAMACVGSILSVAEEALQPLKTGQYYYYQVIGFHVYDMQGKWIGVVTRIWARPGGELYVVTGESKEYLIPAIKEMIEKVDLPGGKMIINPPAGLLDL